MQNTIQTTVYSKTAMLAMKACAKDDDNMSRVILMDAAKVSRALHLKSPKKGIEEDELSTTASSGNEGCGGTRGSESEGITKQRKIAGGSDGKMRNWMQAQIWGLAAGCFMATGFSLLACAAASMAVVLCCTRKEVASPAKKTAPWAAGPRSGASPKKGLRPTSSSKLGLKAQSQRSSTAIPPSAQKAVILPPRPAVASSPRAASATAPVRLAAAKQPLKPTPTGPKITSAPNPGSVAELQKLLATPATPIFSAAAGRPQQRPPKSATSPMTPKVFGAPPGLDLQSGLDVPKTPPVAAIPYTPATFRRELVSIMKELAQHRNAAVAVGQVRAQGVPEDRQGAEFADILTRAMEERNGPVRRTYVAFAAGLAAGGEGSAFKMDECVKGMSEFFSEVYEELCTEVARLDKIVECELVPTLRAVFSAEVMQTVWPLGK